LVERMLPQPTARRIAVILEAEDLHLLTPREEEVNRAPALTVSLL